MSTVNIQELLKQGFEVVEGADIGDTPHMRLIRERGGDTLIVVGTPHGRGARVWQEVWRGSTARGLDEWATRVGQPAMDVVAAEVAARNARKSGGSTQPTTTLVRTVESEDPLVVVMTETEVAK